jgi:hypothetical protein
MKTKIILLLALVWLNGHGQQDTLRNTVDKSSNYPFSVFFKNAYQKYPSVPTGMLEAVSFTTTRINHITHNSGDPESCIGLPKTYGVMGLTLDGKNYFRNNLLLVSQLSTFIVDDIILSPESNILSFAAAYASLKAKMKITGNNIGKQVLIIKALSEIPDDEKNEFALNSYVYSILTFLNNVENQSQYAFPNYKIDLEKVFGIDDFKVLSSPKIIISKKKAANKKGGQYNKSNGNDPSPFSADYPPAIWSPAGSTNYSVGRSQPISAIAIHDTEGSYASAISWFQNTTSGGVGSQVSAHYVIRSSDGQVTQMVAEADKAYHVGNENAYTIGIEHEGYCSQTGWYTSIMYSSSANLVKDICNSGYGISPTSAYSGAACSCTQSSSGCLQSSLIKIKGHQMFPNQTHCDPGINWDWTNYYNLIGGGTTATATITNFTISPSTVCPGGTFTMTITVNATGAMSNVMLGASIKLPAGSYIDDTPHDVYLASIPAGTSIQTRIFTVPAGTTLGTYDVLVGLWQDADGNHIINSGDISLNSKTNAGALIVSGSAPSIPTGLVVQSTSCNSVNLSWNAVSGSGITYEVFKNNTSCSYVFGSSGLGPISSTSGTVTGLSPNTIYYFVVYASNTCGQSGMSNCITVTTSSSPTNATATANPNSACVGGTVNLSGNATGATSWSWSGPNGFSSPSQNLSLSNIQANQAGTYMVTATNACGSTTASANITVNPNPTANITQNGNTLTASCTTSGCNYQWYYNNGLNGNSNSTTCIGSGNYYVVITDVNGCSATSSTLPVTCTVGINEATENNLFSVYPNPTSGKFTIQASQTLINATIFVTNILGEKVFQSANQHIGTLSNLQIDLSSQPNGVYFLNIKTSDGLSQRDAFGTTKKIIINK